jgi:NAD(P)-dependent dehydrogenase (short-subunit alcohol dehydrogenase family)
LALEDAPYPSGEIKLNPGEVVVITGGAKGISASVAYALAKQVKPTLVLIGRSPFPKPEPVWLSSVEGEAAVKKAIFEHEFSSNSASPIQLENAFKAHMSNREITKTLEKISAAGAKAIYYRADVSDADKIKSVFDDVRSAHGPIKAVIHGAGVLEDQSLGTQGPLRSDQARQAVLPHPFFFGGGTGRKQRPGCLCHGQ